VERVNAELEILGADISAHLLDPWRTYLDELGVTPAGQLIHLKGNARVLVAGVRVASGTPPTKTGKRVAFVSLDDGTGVADVAFFDDAQRATGPQLFRSTLMVVEGNTRRTGELGVSVTATRAWDLTALADGTSTVHINTGPSD
jgi:error-prone DNA polymerase